MCTIQLCFKWLLLKSSFSVPAVLRSQVRSEVNFDQTPDELLRAVVRARKPRERRGRFDKRWLSVYCFLLEGVVVWDCVWFTHLGELRDESVPRCIRKRERARRANEEREREKQVNRRLKQTKSFCGHFMAVSTSFHSSGSRETLWSME